MHTRPAGVLTVLPDSGRAWLLLALVAASFLVLAETRTRLELPDSYRTPLSEMVYERHEEWRAPKPEENTWRGGQQQALPDARLKSELLPHYDYSHREDPTTQNLFQNENEMAKPQTNIFRFNF